MSQKKFLDGPSLTQPQFYHICKSPSPQQYEILSKKRKIAIYLIVLNENEESLEDAFPDQKQNKTHKCGAVLTPFTPKEQGYADLTGHFPIKPS